MTIREYPLRSASWETPCCRCGAPMFFAESAYEVEGIDGLPCCSPSCAASLARVVIVHGEPTDAA